MRSQEEKLYANPLLDENAVDKAPGAGYHNPLQESRESRNEEAILASCKCKKNDPNATAPEAPADKKAGDEVKAEMYANPLLDENAVDKAPGAGYHNPLQESRESRNEEAILASCKCKKNDPNATAPEAPADKKAGDEVKAEMYANPLLDENAVDKAPGAGYHNPLQESRESRNEEAILASCKCKKN